MVECAARGTGTPCAGPPSRRCGLCGAVGYCSQSHQMSHWKDHREECERFQQQMRHADALDDFPFSFSKDIRDLENRCSFFVSRGLHLTGLWKCLCCCQSFASFDNLCTNDDWSLPSTACPCTEPKVPLSKCLWSWKDYYQWRCLPLESPVALLLHWPLTVYHCLKLVSTQILDLNDKITIHYLGYLVTSFTDFPPFFPLGPEREVLQAAIFRELGALFPGDTLHIDFFGPAVPQYRDGTATRLSNYPSCSEAQCTCKSPRITGNFIGAPVIKDSAVTIKFHKGFYHECYRYEKKIVKLAGLSGLGELYVWDVVLDDLNGRANSKVSVPHIIVAPNAGIAAYPSWLPTIKLIREMGVPAVFTDFCEEAANLAAKCIQTVTGDALRIPVCILLGPSKPFSTTDASGRTCLVPSLLLKLLRFWNVMCCVRCAILFLFACK